MAFGLGWLRLSPKDFWAMTPRELERAASVMTVRRRTAPDRLTLEGLMRACPDKETNTHG